jgi:hypothetical protein
MSSLKMDAISLLYNLCENVAYRCSTKLVKSQAAIFFYSMHPANAPLYLEYTPENSKNGGPLLGTSPKGPLTTKSRPLKRQ